RLVELNDQAAPALKALAAKTDAPQLARIHAIWVLTQIARKNAATFKAFVPLLKDGDVEIRNQAVRALAEWGNLPSTERAEIGKEVSLLVLNDPSPRVQFSGAIALGKLKYDRALDALAALAQKVAGDNPCLRHAAVVAIANCSDDEELLEWAM